MIYKWDVIARKSFLIKSQRMNTGKMTGISTGEKRKAKRQRLPPDERRQQIIDGAVAFFAKVGLEGKTRDLARELGITQSLLSTTSTPKTP